MNKSETIKSLSDQLGITQKETEHLYDSFVSLLASHLANDEGFSIPKLGSFHSKVREPYKSYNPHYKKMMLLPKKKIVHFSQSSSLKDELNGSGL
ncbi:MAG: HU family DNA-binding protein [Balneolaceae bacterium]